MTFIVEQLVMGTIEWFALSNIYLIVEYNSWMNHLIIFIRIYIRLQPQSNESIRITIEKIRLPFAVIESVFFFMLCVR
jgi:hypothetical protein